VSERRFEWDDAKAADNARKHRVAFNEARTAFEDELAIDAPDEDHPAIEERRVLVGLFQRLRLLTVVYTARNEKIRLITARRSTRTEKARYARQIGRA
jgi:uncharacterized DUF497 family protein